MDILEDNFYINGINNTRIHLKKLVPENSKRVFIVFHGICEHSGRYKNFIDYFIKHETTLYLVDHRGHGLSDGTRGYIEDFNYYSSDALEVIKFVNKAEPNTKFIIAHSLGGLIITYTYLLNKADFKEIKGFVFSAPAYKIKDLPDILEGAVLSITKIIKNKFFTLPISPSFFLNDPEEIKKYKADPLIVRKINPTLFRESLKAIHFCEEHIKKMEKPLLVLIGGKDAVVGQENILNLYQHMSSLDKEKIIYPNSFHELFNDLYRNNVFLDIDSWTEKRTITKSFWSKLNPFSK